MRSNDAGDILSPISAERRITAQSVRDEIEIAIHMGLEDPVIRAQWKRILKDERAPTPEEVVAFAFQQLRESDTKYRPPARNADGRACIPYILPAISPATAIPVQLACISPRVMPAPSPMAYRPSISVSKLLFTGTFDE